MNPLSPAPSSLVNRLTVTGIVAVLASAGVLGTVATLLARQSLENQAQESARARPSQRPRPWQVRGQPPASC